MSIETDLKRIADALETIASHVTSGKVTAAPAAAAEVVDDPLATTSDKKRGRPVKDKTEPTANGTGAATPAAEAKPAGEKVTEQVLREELRQFIVRHEAKGKNKGMEAAADLLKKYGAKTVSTIKPEDYAAIVDFCRKDKASDTASKK